MAPMDDGITRDSQLSDTVLKIVLVFVSVSLYNVVELNFIILATFKRRSGLYFWSFVVATWGIPPYSIGFIIKSLKLACPSWVYVTMIVVGWCCMVTGQSVVLYSRLHIVMRNESRLRLVLGMIITNAIICHIPVAVLVYGANSANPEPFVAPYSVYERVQVTLFFVQETIISALYIHETVALMRTRRGGGISGGGSGRGSTRWLMTHLIVVNIIIVALDITILALEYASMYGMQTSYKALVYSVKLKLEFSILNRLVEMTQGGSSGHDSSYARTRGDNVHNINTNSTAIASGGVPMDTFDGERQKYNRRVGNGMGNTVHVRSGSGAGAGAEDAKPTGAAVVMTTEVTVHRNIRRRSDCDIDLDSLGSGSGATMESGMDGTMGKACAPSNSSEQNIVATHGRY